MNDLGIPLSPRFLSFYQLLQLFRIFSQCEISLSLVKTQSGQIQCWFLAVFPDFVQKILNIKPSTIRKQEFKNVLCNTELKHIWVDW